MPPGRLTIQTTTHPALIITRSSIKADKLAYIAVANKPIIYSNRNKSQIVYIGTTKCGAYRIAASAAAKGYDKLNSHGVSELKFFIITCTSRSGVKTWHKLERGLILMFKEIYGEPPELNVQGKNMEWNDEEKYFTKNRLRNIIEMYSDIEF